MIGSCTFYQCICSQTRPTGEPCHCYGWWQPSNYKREPRPEWKPPKTENKFKKVIKHRSSPDITFKDDRFITWLAKALGGGR